MITHRWWISFPFVVALATLILLIGAVYFALTSPYDGISAISLDGIVEQIDPDSPALPYLHLLDQIIAIDDIPLGDLQYIYAGKNPGDLVRFSILREGIPSEISFELAQPSTFELFTRLVTLFVALVFWSIALGVQALKPAQGSTGIFFLFFEASALLLISGAASGYGMGWTASLLRFLLWLIGPLAVHFHIHFPQKTIIHYQKYLLAGLYTLSLTCGLLYTWFALESDNPAYAIQIQHLQTASRIFLMGNFLLVVVLLFHSYSNATTTGVRSKIRIVVLGGVLSLVPLVTLIILPDFLQVEPILPTAFLSVFLSVLPLTYGYAIFRYRLIEIEKHVNRGATYILVYSVLVFIYLVFSYTLEKLLPKPGPIEPVLNALVVLTLASIFIKLHLLVQKVVDSVFYGGWYDYRSAISEITKGLEQITGLQALADTLSVRLVQTMRLDDVCVFLADPSGDFSTLAVAPPPSGKTTSGARFAPLPRSSLSYLLNLGGVVERNVLRDALAGVTLSAQERQLLESEQIYLWVPIIGHGVIRGLLALGPKFGGDIFSGEDMDILRVVARHMAPLIGNIHMVTRLREHAADLEKRVAERTEELSLSKKRVEAILASVGEGVIVINLDGSIQTVNTAFLAQSGYRQDELTGRSFWDCYRGEYTDDLHEEVLFTVQQDMVWDGEMVSFRKDGGRYDVHLTIAPLPDENGAIIGYVGSQRDITQQKELDRLKDIFVSDVSHELRTPTTNIGLYLDLLDNALPEKRTHYIKILKDQSRLLIKLVEDILDLSRLTTKKHKTPELERLDLNTVVEQVIMAHKPQAESARLSLAFTPAENLGAILGEPNQLSRLINNLVSNAIHYTPQGWVTVRTYQDQENVCLEVCDSGMGIEADDLPHLFERFYRGRSVRQSRIHGTGLGLAIVKEIVDMHGSSITIQSELGVGSTFKVNFPMIVGEPWLVKQS